MRPITSTYAGHTSDDLRGEPRGDHHQQILCGPRRQDTNEKARGTTENREMAEFGERILSQPMMKYNKENQLCRLRWQYGLCMGE